MKIFIVIVVLLNVYGVLAEPHIFRKHKFHHQTLEDPYLHRHHERHRNDVLALTIDDFADVLLSLPESIGNQAYRTFLSLGEFLPADTKAHKFFTSIPQAISRKSIDRFIAMQSLPSEQLPSDPMPAMQDLPRVQLDSNPMSVIQTLPPVQLASNPMFMIQPTGFQLSPLPLHPMFSSSPGDNFIRVPCRHTQAIQVPMHMFDMQISKITHKISPEKSALDDSSEDDDADIDDLWDMISSIANQDYDPTYENSENDNIEGKKSSDKDVPSISESDNVLPAPEDDSLKNEEEISSIKPVEEKKEEMPLSDRAEEKKEESPSNDSAEENKEETPSTKLVEQEKEETPITNPIEGENKETPENNADDAISKEHEPSSAEENASKKEDISIPALAHSTEDTTPVKEEKTSTEEVETMKQEVSDPAKNLQSESAEIVPAPASKPVRRRKKAPAKRERMAESMKEIESQPSPAPASEQKGESAEEVSTPIPTKRIRKKRTNTENVD